MTSALQTIPSETTAAELRSVAANERIDLVDIVRGFALYGVLLANLVWITTDVVLTDARLAQLPTAPLDRVVKPLVVFFVDHKFYTLFSFLFGLGFAIQLSRADERGRVVTTTYARRVGILAAIGLVHISVLWYGDILLIYGLCGLVLLLVRQWNVRVLLVLAFVLALFARAAVGAYPLLVGQPARTNAGAAMQGDAEKERELAVFDSASYRAIAAENRTYFYQQIVVHGIGLFLLPQVFARFLLGLYVGRRQWAHRTAELVPSLRRLLPWSGVLAVAGTSLMMYVKRLQHAGVVGLDSYRVHASAVVEEAGVLAMSFCYLSTIVLLFHGSTTWRRRLGHLAPVGRMALTNYLTHSLLYLVLFTGVGLGLYGEVGPTLCLVFSVVIFSAQMAFSRWWFSPAQAVALAPELNRNKTYVCPTLTLFRAMWMVADEGFRKDARLKYLPAGLRERFQAFVDEPRTTDDVELWRQFYERHRESTRLMHEGGVPILAGTDGGEPYSFPAFGIHDELRLLVDAGLTPLEALQTATLNPARFFGRESELGTVAVGKLADLVLLAANPLTAIGNTTKINAVVASGRLYRRPDLDHLLAKVEAAANK